MKVYICQCVINNKVDPDIQLVTNNEDTARKYCEMKSEEYSSGNNVYFDYEGFEVVTCLE